MHLICQKNPKTTSNSGLHYVSANYMYFLTCMTFEYDRVLHCYPAWVRNVKHRANMMSDVTRLHHQSHELLQNDHG